MWPRSGFWISAFVLLSCEGSTIDLEGEDAGVVTAIDSGVLDVPDAAVGEAAYEVFPDPVVFSDACSDTQQIVTLRNAGPVPIEVHEVRLEGPDARWFEATVTGPRFVRIGGETSIAILQNQVPESPRSAVLAIDVEDETIRVPVSAETGTESFVDTFRMSGPTMLDVLIVVDGRETSEVADRVVTEMRAFADEVERRGWWVRVGVMPMGGSRRARLTAPLGEPAMLEATDSGRLADALESRLRTAFWTGGTDSDALQQVRETLAGTDNNQLGGNLVAPFLNVIIASTRDDTSAGPPSGYALDTGSFYDFVFPFEGGACALQPIVRYADRGLSAYRNDLCSTGWNHELSYYEFIVEPVWGWSLSHSPRPGTVEVLVRGQSIPAVDANGTANWTLDPGTPPRLRWVGPFGHPHEDFDVRYDVLCSVRGP